MVLNPNRNRRWLALAVLLGSFVAGARAESVSFEKRVYHYSTFTPKRQGKLPAILLLHGAGGAGGDMLELWKPFAKTHGLVLVAPDLPRDPAFEAIAPRFFRVLMDDAAARAGSFDPRRLYVFGYSMGGYLAYDAAMFDSEYFAAAGVYAHFISPEYTSILKAAKRTIPIAVYAGVNDELIPIQAVRGTRDLLKSAGFPVHYREFAGQGHNYGDIASEVHADVWRFFERERLP